MPVPAACAAEIEGFVRTLGRDPVPLHLLDPDDYPLDACRTLMGEVRRRLDQGPGVAVADRIPIEKLAGGRPQVEAVFWLLGQMVGRPVVQTRDGEIMVEVTDTGVKKRIGVRGYRTSVAQPPARGQFLQPYPAGSREPALSAHRTGGRGRAVS